WEQRKLGELCTISKGHGYSKADIRDAGTPLILYGRLYTQYESRIENVDTFAVEQEGSLLSKGNEVIVPASGETAEDIAVASSVRRSGIIFGGDLNVVTPVSRLDPDYTALAITYSKAHDDLARRAQGKSVVHVHGNDIAEVEISYPSESEQKRISTVVLGLDNLITLHQRECVKPPFTQSLAWEQRKLGEFSKKRTTKNADGTLSETFTNSAEQGVISQLDYFDHDITNDANISGYYVVQPDDFVYNPRISATAPCGPINRNRLNRAGVMSPLYTVFSVDASVDKTYLEHYFKTSRWHDFMFLEGNSGARSDRFSISDATFFEMPIWCPEISEQKVIAKQLETADHFITLHQRMGPIFCFCAHGSRTNFASTLQG
ncbi:MAG: restriction endonuclease subunit S, partial [Eggerthellaceae bacterium]